MLVVTSRSDVTADAVVDELNRRGEPVVRLDTSEFPVTAGLAVALTEDGWAGTIHHGECSVDLAAVRSVWWRRPTEFHTPADWDADARAFAASEARAGFLGVLGSLPVRWINHPAADAAANYKPRQLAIAARSGLTTPRTVITNDPTEAQTFAKEVGRVVYKALGGGVRRTSGWHESIPTTVLTTDQIDDSVAGTAHLFQELVEKAFEVRLTVIGERMFAAAIHAHTDATRLDWRTDYSALTYRTIAVPDRVAAGVRRIMAELGLFFGALDFAVTPGGEWVFFEINPNGQWHWLTHHTDLPLVATMADALQKGRTA